MTEQKTKLVKSNDLPKVKEERKEIRKVNRVYNRDMEIDSDTFKLDVANYAKNLSFDDNNPLLIGVEHCHFFHTFDSNGKKQIRCNAVGGHTHEVTISIDENGDFVGECSAPISNKKLNDKHTHKVSYLKSDRFKVRSINKDAQAYIANMENI